MLVVTRRAHESVLVGHDVVVTVAGFQGDTVLLDVLVPDGVTVAAATGQVAPNAETGRRTVGLKELEAIRIGESISISVARLKRGESGTPVNVRLGIDAPRELRISREDDERAEEANGSSETPRP